MTDDTLFRMLSAVVYSYTVILQKEGTGVVLGKLGRVSLTQANRPGVKPTPALRMSLPKMRLDLGMIRRPRGLRLEGLSADLPGFGDETEVRIDKTFVKTRLCLLAFEMSNHGRRDRFAAYKRQDAAGAAPPQVLPCLV